MNNLTKICKVCKVEQQRHGDFSGRFAVCCKCVYAKKKDYFKQYNPNQRFFSAPRKRAQLRVSWMGSSLEWNML